MSVKMNTNQRATIFHSLLGRWNHCLIIALRQNVNHFPLLRDARFDTFEASQNGMHKVEKRTVQQSGHCEKRRVFLLPFLILQYFCRYPSKIVHEKPGSHEIYLFSSQENGKCRTQHLGSRATWWRRSTDRLDRRKNDLWRRWFKFESANHSLTAVRPVNLFAADGKRKQN